MTAYMCDGGTECSMPSALLDLRWYCEEETSGKSGSHYSKQSQNTAISVKVN